MPNPFINPKFYLANYPDLAATYGSEDYVSAVHHWVRHGFSEGRRGCVVFDVGFYLLSHQDLSAAFGPQGHAEAFQHWKNFGRVEGRQTAANGSRLELDERESTPKEDLGFIRVLDREASRPASVGISVVELKVAAPHAVEELIRQHSLISQVETQA